LRQQDYATGYVGKFHHGKADSLNDRGFPLNHGFDFFYGFSGGTKHYLHHNRKNKKGKLHEGPMWVQREQKDIEGFTTELFGEQGRRFIRTNKAKPFYLCLSFNAVHNFTHQLPPDYLKEKGLKGFAGMKPDEDYWEWRKKIGYPAHPEGRDYYLGQLYFLDREIGFLIKELNEQGLAENTAIIFVSDNGGSLVTYANNGNLKGGKYTLFEGGTRVPIIISYPEKFNSGGVNNSITSTMDLFPTICALVDAPAPAHLDGINLYPMLSGEKPSQKRPSLFWDTKHESAIRKGRWKLLITNKTPSAKLQIVDTPKGEFLFDLETDPGEKFNLAGQYPEKVDNLRTMLKDWQDKIEQPVN
jgi:arylsulfatase A-like enzyme